MKRIAIPCINQQVSPHFGHAPQFGFFDVDDNSGKIVGEEYLDAPPHEPGVLPKWVADNRGNVVLAGGMGGRAQQLFAQHGVEVVVGVDANDPRQAVEAYLQGTLGSGTNACNHGEGHACH